MSREGLDSFFFGEDVRNLIPIILQYMVHLFRRLYAENCSPHWFRSRQGCNHSIVVRTGASHNVVQEFVDKWCLANEGVLSMLETTIKEAPHENYFA